MRWLKRVLLAVLILLALAAIVLVVPSQLQLRAIAPPLPAEQDLLALRVDGGPVSVRYLNTSSQSAPGRALAHPAYLLTWADGRHFLIDAGMTRDAADEFGVLLERMWGAAPQAFHGSVHEQLAETSARVTAMGFTHLHIDHVEGARLFCAGSNAPSVFQTRTQRTVHNRNTREGAALVAACPQAPALDGMTLAPVPGYPGLAMFALGGHTPGSTLFAAALPDRILLFAGDTTNSKADLLDDRPKAWWYSYLAVPEYTARTAELRRYLAQLDRDPRFAVVVAHDLKDGKKIVAAFQAAAGEAG